MLNILICDDMQEQRDALARMVREALTALDCSTACIDVCDCAETLEAAMKKKAYSILFLDIQLAGSDGVGLAIRCNKIAPDMQIIFVSGYLATVTRIYDARHLYFLAKPVSTVRLLDALSRALSALAAQDKERVELPLLHGVTRILAIREILYAERTGRVTILHTVDGEELCTKKTVAELAEMLPQDRFSRPHSSFLVQLAHVYSFDRLNVTMNGGACIPISNARRAPFRDLLEKQLLQ